ncbi:hypothetical protein SAMN02745166_00006 [Prosthecobacter debontii]|uniref:Uncharacterized protein n=1 Tax=Prosthecobacter debontii TaxID=48467 RepID=A0A1T4WED4_9BACT|nr:hypothetical protein [Prosthecobacter debontii]SKA75275.1 hypothetical protein SAMN02745166_00006 [Prosthecobacter debontii]
MKTTSSILKFYTLLMLAVGLSQSLSAQSTVSPTGIPVITSFVPASAPVGESVLANLASDRITNGGAVIAEPLTVTHIQFRTTIGLPVSAPVIYVTPTLIRFTIPNLAITGPTTLMSGSQLRSRVQSSFSVVSLSKRSPGISVINTAQWDIGSVKTGSTELLPANTVIPAGQAHFISRVLSTRTALPLNLTFVTESTLTSITRQPLFSIQESVKLPTTPGTTVTTLLKRVDLTIEPFTVTEVLRMGGNATSTPWNLQFGGQFNRMVVTDDGRLTVNPTLQIGNMTPVVFTIDEASAEITKGLIRFRVRRNGVLAGPALSLASPFDVIAANQIGSITASGDTPMLLRRAN